MAKRENDREDLLREATALVERAELQVEGLAEPVVIGFRRDGAASVFFGADPVYQFNAAGELRRAYVGGLLYKAERGKLVALTRQRTTSEVVLLRRMVTVEETSAQLAKMTQLLAHVRQSLEDGRSMLRQEIPAGQGVVKRFRSWLDRLPEPILIADRPNVA